MRYITPFFDNKSVLK